MVMASNSGVRSTAHIGTQACGQSIELAGVLAARRRLTLERYRGVASLANAGSVPPSCGVLC